MKSLIAIPKGVEIADARSALTLLAPPELSVRGFFICSVARTVRGRIANPKHESSQFNSDTLLQFNGDTEWFGRFSHKELGVVRLHLALPTNIGKYMKIQYIQGDLFSTEHKYILHGCNSLGVMGSGIAKTVRQLYPAAYDAYNLWCSKGFRLGKYLAVTCDDKVIINAVTQQKYGKLSEQRGPNPVRYVSYDAIAEIFAELNTQYAGNTITMPLVGCDLGGGSWSVVSAIIESECKTIQPIVYRL